MSEIIGVGQISLLDLNDALISGTPPKNPTVGNLWIDESLDPPMLKKWNGEAWIDLGELDPDLSVTLEFISETLGNMANDNLIDFKERQIIKDKITEIIGYVIADTTTTLPTVATLDNGGKGGFWSVRKSARNVGIATNHTAYANLTTRYNDLKSYLESLTPIDAWDVRNANKDVVISVTKSTFRDRWLQYYLAVDALAEATALKIKENENALRDEVDEIGQDVEDVIGRVTEVESKVTDEAIINKVTSSEKYLLDLKTIEDKVDDISGLIRVRYIRDHLNGSDSNTSNYWVEIEAITDDGTNVALGKTVTGSSNPSNLSVVTDGDTSSTNYVSTTGWVQVDLGKVYDNIDYVKVWHYYADGRIYNDTKTEVSEDGVNWITIFDSAEQGTYTETDEGKTHTVNADTARNLRDVGSNITVIASQINNVEEMMTSEGITTVISESVFYENLMNDLGMKADLDQLGDMATRDEVEELASDIDGMIHDAIEGIDFEPYATKLELEETSRAIMAKFSATGGMNLVKNSIGFADLDFWEHVYSNRDTTTISNLELDTLGFGSGFYFPISENKGIHQDIPVVAGQIYTMSWYLNKATGGTGSSYRFYIQIQEHDGTAWVTRYSHPDNTTKITNGYEYEYVTYTPTADTIRIRFISYADCEANLTGIMLNIGDVPLQWSLATGEMYNTNIRMDINGIRVSQLNEDRVEIGYTHITPDEFAGYYDADGNGTFEKIFYLNGEETVTKKLVAQEEITMGTIKVIKIDTDRNSGWAFVPTVDMSDNVGDNPDDGTGDGEDGTGGEDDGGGDTDDGGG